MHYLVMILLVLALSSPASAEAPDCTGDRHYDGVACCPLPPTTEPSTTTTTLPTEACPQVVCQPVVCECNEGTTVVQAQACPEAPNYYPCRRLKNGGYKCPRPGAPRRILMPEKKAY